MGCLSSMMWSLSRLFINNSSHQILTWSPVIITSFILLQAYCSSSAIWFFKFVIPFLCILNTQQLYFFSNIQDVCFCWRLLLVISSERKSSNLFNTFNVLSLRSPLWAHYFKLFKPNSLNIFPFRMIKQRFVFLLKNTET